VPGFGARIFGVDLGVDEAVEGHGRGPRAYHRNDYPGDDAEVDAGEAVFTEGEKRAGQREREGEDRMLELDHVERQTSALEKLHAKGVGNY